MNTVLDTSSWYAQLDLTFATQGKRTRLTQNKHVGPLVVQKPFYPEGDPCHVYLLHPPGGIVGSDHLVINVTVDDSAHALLTTPAATKFYRSQTEKATQVQHLTAKENATLEWLPQETILFDGCNSNLTTRIELTQTSNFIGWEILCFGRPACNERFDQGEVFQRFELWCNDTPLLIDRTHVQGKNQAFASAWGLAAQPIMATLVVFPATQADVERVRSIIVTSPTVMFSVSLLGDVMVCRYLGKQAIHARECFTQVWAILRPHLLGRPHCAPRIWNT